MTDTLKAIGLFGGTFDPIHFGHLRTAWEISNALSLKEVRFIPCHTPPHRKAPSACAQDRLAMVSLAIAATPTFTIDEREIRRGGPSYTIDTLRSIRQELPEESLCLIIGSDAFASFMSWHSWEDIIKLANVIVMHRPGHQEPFPAALKNAFEFVHEKEILHQKKAGALFFQPVTSLAISATVVREELANSRSARFLIPKSVETYINAQGLYHLLEK